MATFLGSVDDASDIVQETFVRRLVRSPHDLRYTPPTRVRLAIGRHVAFDHFEVDFIPFVPYRHRLLAR